MPEAFRPDYPSNPFRVDPIYIRMTQPRNTNDNRSSLPSVQDLFGQLSVTSQFKVSLFFGSTDIGYDDVNRWLINCGIFRDSINNLKYEFMCHSATLPGSSFSTVEESGSRQGITEKFAVLRQFPDLTLEFYVDSDYGIIRLFEEWLNYINPLHDGTSGSEYTPLDSGSTSRRSALQENNYYRVKYPDQYKRDLSVTKFERNILVDSSLPDRAFSETPSMLTYRFINAFPTQLTALPVSYEGSTVTKTSITFSYDRYVVQRHAGTRADGSNVPPTISEGQGILQQDIAQNLTGNSSSANNTTSIAFDPNTSFINPQ